MLKKLILTALLTLALSTAAWAQEEKVYVNGIDANFPPFAFIGPDGQAHGFDIDALNWMAKEMGFKVEHKAMEWDGIVPSLEAKKIDMIASGLSVNKERAEKIAFSKPYWVTKQVLLVAADSALTIDDVVKGGKTIGVQAGTSDAVAMEDMNGKDGRNYTLKLYNSSALAAQDVVNGNIDAAVMNDAPAADAAGKIAVKIIGEAGIPEEQFAIGINKADTELLATINAGLEKLMADPYWQELIKKYNPGGIPE